MSESGVWGSIAPRSNAQTWIVPGVVVVLVALIAGGIGWWVGRSSSSVVSGDLAEFAPAGEVDRTLRDPLYSPPASLRSVIVDTKAFTVEVWCAGGSGAGWIIETSAEPLVRPRMRSMVEPRFEQIVVTAEHVISDCRAGKRPVRVRVGTTAVDAVLMNWDVKRDVATVGISADTYPSARPFTLTPDGSWAMTVGAPLDGPVVPVIGQVVRDDGFDLLLHMTVRPGNSGGPVVNSRGEVVGTIGGTVLDEETRGVTGWSYAAPVEALCEKLFECSLEGIDASRP